MNRIFMSSENHKESGYIIWPRSAFANRVAAIPCFISYEKWASWMGKTKNKKIKIKSHLPYIWTYKALLWAFPTPQSI